MHTPTLPLHRYGLLDLPDQGVYKGQFVQGKYEGVGLMRMAGGDEYLGMFKQGTYHGIGQYSAKGKVTIAVFDKGRIHQDLSSAASAAPD